MISNIDTEYNRNEAVQVQAAEAAVKTDEVTSAAAPAQKTEETSGIKMQYHADRVEISTQGQRIAAEQSTQSSEVSLLAQAAEDEESSSSTNLTTLTEQQLSDLASNGTITQQQLNTEIARRNAAKQMQEAQNQPDTARAAAFVEE